MIEPCETASPRWRNHSASNRLYQCVMPTRPVTKVDMATKFSS
jgi:hypothetical protein